jgi:hypothetical protein
VEHERRITDGERHGAIPRDVVDAATGFLTQHRLVVDGSKTVGPHELAAVVHVGDVDSSLSGIESHIVEVDGRDRKLIGAGEKGALAVDVDAPDLGFGGRDEDFTGEDDTFGFLQAADVELTHLAFGIDSVNGPSLAASGWSPR